MKHMPIVAWLALAVSALALAAVLAGGRRSGAGAASVAPTPPAPADRALTARLDALSGEVRELHERLALLELRPASVPRAPATVEFASVEELESLRRELRDAIAGSGAGQPAAPSDPAALKEQVATTLSEIRKSEAVTAARASLEKRVAGLDDTMREIEPWLALTPGQSSGVRAALQAQYEREAELVRLWQEGGDPALIAERKRGDHELLRNDLSLYLDAQQLETFWAKVR